MGTKHNSCLLQCLLYFAAQSRSSSRKTFGEGDARAFFGRFVCGDPGKDPAEVLKRTALADRIFEHLAFVIPEGRLDYADGVVTRLSGMVEKLLSKQHCNDTELLRQTLVLAIDGVIMMSSLAAQTSTTSTTSDLLFPVSPAERQAFKSAVHEDFELALELGYLGMNEKWVVEDGPGVGAAAAPPGVSGAAAAPPGVGGAAAAPSGVGGAAAAPTPHFYWLELRRGLAQCQKIGTEIVVPLFLALFFPDGGAQVGVDVYIAAASTNDVSPYPAPAVACAAAQSSKHGEWHRCIKVFEHERGATRLALLIGRHGESQSLYGKYYYLVTNNHIVRS